MIQFDPPRDVDTYVHRSGRTGRAGNTGISVLMFSPQQARDIVRIERDLGHGFKFDLVGPPSTEAALKAAAKTSSIASQSIPDETAQYFKEAAAELLESSEDSPEEVVARCLAAISRRSSDVKSRSLLTGELGMTTIEMSNTNDRKVGPGDVMFTVSKLSRMSRRDDELSFDGDVGKIQTNPESGTAVFDMNVEDAKKLIEFSADIDAGGAVFKELKELEIERGRHFGKPLRRNNGRFDNRRGGNPRWNNDRRNTGGYQRNNRSQNSRNYHGQNHRSNHENRGRDNRNNNTGGYRGRYDNRRNQGGQSYDANDSW